MRHVLARGNRDRPAAAIPADQPARGEGAMTARGDVWRRLRQPYEGRGMVLALGAGVSAGSGLPQWTDLLRFLARRYLTHPRISFDDLVRYCDENPTMIAGMVRQRFSSQRAFGEAVRQALYSTGPF